MRFLVDENLSPRLASLLSDAGHESVHVRDLDLKSAPDAEIMRVAVLQQRVVLSGDSDFGELLARTNADRPSILLLRRQGNRRARDIAALLLVNLPAVADDLLAGAIVVIDNERLRVRPIPLQP